MEGHPIYDITIDPEFEENGIELGYTQKAFVKNPAILVKGFTFAEDGKTETPVRMHFADTEKMRLIAPVMIPMHIYRIDDEHGEYYTKFTKETIDKLFMKNRSKSRHFEDYNLDHNEKLQVGSKAYSLETWQVQDPEMDTARAYGFTNLVAGTIFEVVQFTDRKYFEEEIIAKDRTGISIEGYMGMKLIKQKNNKMEKKKFSNALIEDGTKVFAEKFEVGFEMYVIDDNGDKAPIYDAVHKLEDGTEITTVDGKITEVKPVEKPVENADAPADKDKEEMPATPVANADLPTEAPVGMTEDQVLAIVNPLIQEVYSVIAALKAEIMSTTEKESAPVQMSEKQKYEARIADRVRRIANLGKSN